MASNPDHSHRKRTVELILKAQKIQNLHKSERLPDISEDYETMEENIWKDEELSSEILLDVLAENDSAIAQF